MKLLLMHFSPASYSVFIPGPNILFNTIHLEVSLKAMLPRLLYVEHFFNLRTSDQSREFIQTLLKIKRGEKCCQSKIKGNFNKTH